MWTANPPKTIYLSYLKQLPKQLPKLHRFFGIWRYLPEAGGVGSNGQGGRKPLKSLDFSCFQVVGAARFELTTSCSQSRRSTRLSYAPCMCAEHLMTGLATQRKEIREEFRNSRDFFVLRLASCRLGSSQAPRMSEISAREIMALSSASRGVVFRSATGTARSSVNLPDRVRRRALRWPPQPSRSPMSWA